MEIISNVMKMIAFSTIFEMNFAQVWQSQHEHYTTGHTNETPFLHQPEQI
jgi:hypothetical protein